MQFSIWTVVLIGLYSDEVSAKLKSFSPASPRKEFICIKPTDFPIAPSRTSTKKENSHYTILAKKFVKEKLGFDEFKDYVVKQSYTTGDKVGHMYLSQVINGKQVFNANININVLLNRTILSYGNSFARTKGKGESNNFFVALDDPNGAKASLINKVKVALRESKAIEGEINIDHIKESIKQDGSTFTYISPTTIVQDLEAVQGWLQLSDGSLEPVWSMDIQLNNEWFNSMVSLKTNQLVSLADWKSEMTYAVYPFNGNGPANSEQVLVKNPYDCLASPAGWHSTRWQNFHNTRGNNAHALFIDNTYLEFAMDNNPERTPNGGRNMKFNFPLNPSRYNIERYLDASITNAFYVTNMIHDLLYRYGFDEASGNFQENNFGRGGEGSDSVQVYVQDSYTPDNASIFTPKDGKSPLMRLGVYSNMKPSRDAALYNSIIIHEYGHGLSNRLVGGPDNPNCLFRKEGRGMGEGWSDFLSILVFMKEEHTRSTRIIMDPFYSNIAQSGRQNIYLFDLNDKFPAYNYLNQISEPHYVGHVWTTILYEVYWNLVDKLGFTADWMNEGTRHPTRYGNTLMLKLLIDSMKMMPCEPTFIEARDALLDADAILTNGSNYCEIWRGFAARGMGQYAGFKPNRDLCANIQPENDATFGQTFKLPTLLHYRNSFTVPETCTNA